MENWFLRLRCKDEGIVGSFKRPAPSPNESSPANVANHTVPTGQASLNEKNLLKQNAWQVFPVLIRSLAAPDCGVGGNDRFSYFTAFTGVLTGLKKMVTRLVSL